MVEHEICTHFPRRSAGQKPQSISLTSCYTEHSTAELRQRVSDLPSPHNAKSKTLAPDCLCNHMAIYTVLYTDSLQSVGPC